MDDDVFLGCCGGCCLLCCACAADAICNWCTFLVALALAAVLVAAFGIALPVRTTVTDASLARLDLAASSSLSAVAYNLSLTVRLRNRNWAMRVETTAPLDAELRFAGRRFDGARLADPGARIPPRGAEEFRVLAASSPGGALAALAGGDTAAAELARQRAEGVFEMELRVVGEVRYRPVHAGRSRRLEATCNVKMLMPDAPRGTGTTATQHTHLVVLPKDVRCY